MNRRISSQFKLTTIAVREHEAPILLGSFHSRAEYSYFVMCNEEKREGSDVFVYVLCQELRNLGLSLDFAVECPLPPAKNNTCGGG